MMAIVINVLIIAAIVIGAIIFVRRGERRWWEKFSKNPYNFPFRWHGKTLWYSRSFAVSAFIFCRNSEGEWCVLANKRGKGAADFNHMWNCIAGYIDFNERAEEAAVREIREECKINIDEDEVQFYKLISCPSENHQNIVARFFAKIEDKTTDSELFAISADFEGGEKDEVEEVAWIPVSHIDNYEWAFNHKEVIAEIFLEKIL